MIDPDSQESVSDATLELEQQAMEWTCISLGPWAS